MEILLVFSIGIMNIICFMLGVSLGQKTKQGERVEMPVVNPVAAFREHQSYKQADRSQQELMTVLENIDNYNGTSAGQKDVN